MLESDMRGLSPDDAIRQHIKDIKKELHAFMNGVASSSMRNNGIDGYRVIFGVDVVRLKELASEYGKNHALAQELWKESVRECKILATMIQPVESFYPEIADIWVSDIKTQEMAEQACMNLFQFLPYASEKAFEWMADERVFVQMCGFLLCIHLMRRAEFNDSSLNEFVDQALASFHTDFTSLKKVVWRSMSNFAELSADNARKLRECMIGYGWDKDENLKPYVDYIADFAKEEV